MWSSSAHPDLSGAGWAVAGRVPGTVAGAALVAVLPLMAVVWQRSRGAQLRGAMSAFFLVGFLMSVLDLVVVGAIDGGTVLRAGALVPFVLGG